ncbi:MAG: hypothetical protein AB4057_13510 [Crocosphaera sp.]
MPKQSRSQEDINREKRVYCFLLQLSNVKNEQGKPAVKDIASKWGYRSKDRAGQKFVERILSNLYDQKDDKPALPSLSLSRLVEILKGIENYWNIEATKEEKENTDSLTSLMPKRLKKIEKIQAIRKYCELSRQEKQKLNLPVDFKTYIQENFIDTEYDYVKISDASTSFPHEKYADDYINIQKQKKDTNLILGTIKGEYFDNLIEEVISDRLFESYTNLSKNQDNLDIHKRFEDWANNKKNQERLKQIKEKVKNEIQIIAVRSGLEIGRYQIYKILYREFNQEFEKAYKKQWEFQLPDKVIKQLTANIIENSRLSENNNISIYFRYLELEKVGPLPFESDEDDNLINEDLSEFDPDKIATKETYSIFKKYHAYKVKVYFRLQYNNGNIDFCEEISGVSSILSLVRKALNRALLWDIPCLGKYFPVMQEVSIEDQLFGRDSLATVLSKSRGRLVEIEDLQYLLKRDKDKFNLDFYVKGLDIVEDRYIGFDVVESIAISGFYARLKLIEKTGIEPNTYLNELKNRIDANKDLSIGKKYLRSYPFSLLAMEKHLNKTILNAYKDKPKWTKTAYKAKLCIIEGYLAEGLVKAVERRLKELESHEQYFSHFLKASYYLCWAEYLFVCHEDEINKTKQEIVKDCQDYLQKAENELRERFLEFFRIGEIAQGNLSPLYHHWTKIYIMRGRLSLYFPRFLSKGVVTNVLPSLVDFGKARVYYAPRGGDSYLCGQASLYQSWCYLMQGYIGSKQKGFDKKTCIDWAKKLIDQALLNYKEISEECYRDYTDNLFSRYYNRFSDLEVEPPPFLHLIPSDQNLPKNENNGNKNNFVKIYSISAELVKRYLEKNKQDEKVIDIFGQHSSLYFFVLGMIRLCDDYPAQSQEDIKKHFKEAYNYFVSSWAIAQGCTELEGTNKLERKCNTLKLDTEDQFPIKDEFNVSKLRSLYFHRISEWMDLGKIFMAVCQVILREDDYINITNHILNEVEDVGIFSKVPSDFEEFASGQEFYNRHLESQFKRIKEYLRYCLKNGSKKSLSEYRDEVVENIFLRLRGD